jgi:ribonuclease HI
MHQRRLRVRPGTAAHARVWNEQYVGWTARTDGEGAGPSFGASARTCHLGPPPWLQLEAAMEYPEENALNIYTDGSMLRGPRRGGAGLLFIAVDEEGNEEHREEMLPGYAGATQNQMELEGPIQGLKMATGRHPPFDPSRYRKIVIKTDATYVAENFRTAASVWSRNGWKTREGKPVDNAKQWKELVRLAVLSSKQGKPVRIVRVEGKKSPRTKAVDRLAKSSAKSASKRQLTPAEVRRKKTDRPIEIGSVEMHGQVMTIHIFKSEYQPIHRLSKYWYSVTSETSPYHGRASVIYSELHHLRRRTYRVRVNEETGDPRILEELGEVEPSQ